jgi:hypothetical protein
VACGHDQPRCAAAVLGARCSCGGRRGARPCTVELVAAQFPGQRGGGVVQRQACVGQVVAAFGQRRGSSASAQGWSARAHAGPHGLQAAVVTGQQGMRVGRALEAHAWTATAAAPRAGLVRCEVGALVTLGPAPLGERRYVPLLGGSVQGPGLERQHRSRWRRLADQPQRRRAGDRRALRHRHARRRAGRGAEQRPAPWPGRGAGAAGGWRGGGAARVLLPHADALHHRCAGLGAPEQGDGHRRGPAPGARCCWTSTAGPDRSGPCGMLLAPMEGLLDHQPARRAITQRGRRRPLRVGVHPRHRPAAAGTCLHAHRARAAATAAAPPPACRCGRSCWAATPPAWPTTRRSWRRWAPKAWT